MKAFKHQKEGKEFIVGRGGTGALFWDVGCGKTRTAIEIFAELKSRNLAHTMCVVCPLNLIRHAWFEDIAKWSGFTYSSLRDKDFNIKADVWIVNYEWILRNELAVEKHCFLVLDESSKIKNPSAKTTKKLIKISDRVQYKLIMTGTPAPNSEMEYFAQMRFLDVNIFGNNELLFKNRYFHLGRGNQTLEGQHIDRKTLSSMFKKGWKYVTTGAKREAMFARMKPYIHQVDKSKCLDLPPVTFVNRFVTMGKAQKQHYKEMKDEMITFIGEKDIFSMNGAVKYMKLRQITSGFAINTDGEVLEILEQPKLAELKAILEEVGKKQVIIWINFHREVDKVLELLGANKCATLYGLTKDKDENIRQFRSGEKQYFIAHPASAGHGLTLVNCSTQIFYSLDYSYERYHQALGRINRPGQTEPCTYIHILAENSLDDSILQVLQGKGDLLTIMRDYMLKK